MKKILVLGMGLLLILTLFNACGKKQKQVPDSRWFEYIKAYTSGTVYKESVIRIVFQKPLIAKEKVGQDASDIIDFNPGIKGKGEWSSPNEISFTPKNPLESGQKYEGVLNLKEYLPETEDLKNFVFYFQVIPQDFEVYLEGLISNEKNSEYQYKGKIATADVADSKAVEELLESSFEGKSLKIEWEHNADRKNHAFLIKNVFRDKVEKKLILSFNGSSLKLSKKWEKEQTVPVLDEFSVIEIEPVNKNESYILLRFSDSLKPNQNLIGMIRVQSQPQKNEGMTDQEVRFSQDQNLLKVFLQNKVTGNVSISVDTGVKNSQSKSLKNPFFGNVIFKSLHPAVRFAGKGTILPQNDHLTVPFEAVNADSVQVTAMEIYSHNMGQFFQVNNYEGASELKRVGRYLWRKTIPLQNANKDYSKWERYQLDVTDLFKQHPGSLFRLTLSIIPKNSTYSCSSEIKGAEKEPDMKNTDDRNLGRNSYYYEGEGYYYNDGYEYGGYDYDEDSRWEQRDDPCSKAYYRYNPNVKSEKNLIASNIGIIAKMGSDEKMTIVTTDIRNAKPISSKISVYNYQNHVIGEGETDSNGFSTVSVQGVPFYIMAQKDGEKGYLKVSGENVLMTSHFDVGGEEIKKGVKGFLYGERGVWRPGDPIYLTLVIEDKKETLPKNHPVSLDLFNPKGQLAGTFTPKNKAGKFYAFELSTSSAALTGNWKAVAKIGGLSFSKNLKIETIVPNRLKIDFSLNEKVLTSSLMPLKAKLSSAWLHGATAANLAANVEVRLVPKPVQFTQFANYTFEDQSRVFASEKKNLYDGRLDSNGKSEFDANFTLDNQPSEMLEASFITRVFEDGGGYSSETVSLPYHYYKNYVGIKITGHTNIWDTLVTEKDQTVEIASLNHAGKPVSLPQVEMTIYRLRWNYWWDKSGSSLANYMQGSGNQKIMEEVVSTRNGTGKWVFKIKYPEFGTYFIRACDLEGNHCSGKMVYVDWPDWYGKSKEQKNPGAYRLNFSANKEKFFVGEKAQIHIPTAEKGRALVSLENGSGVLKQWWVETGKGENKISFPITEEMLPNIYVHISLIQPHKDKKNDSPIRLYGILPLFVEDPKTVLQPVIYASDEMRPQANVQVKVKEKNNKEMDYTLAVVDEGLLGITRHKAPDLHDEFYKREGLGVKTWDIFDEVVGAYGAALERILAIGGSDEAQNKESHLTEKRFPPVAMYFGPFHLKSGETNSHHIKLPQYFGAVRLMVVAGNNGSYGTAEKSVYVRQPLMLLGTLPRVLGPGEELKIPVNVFVTQASIKNVTVSIETDDMIQISGAKQKQLRFNSPGDQLITFDAKVAPKIGLSKIRLKVTGNQESAAEEITIGIRTANPPITKIARGYIEGKKSWKMRYIPHGMKNTNHLTLEVSTLPPMNLEERLRYLIQYPHGCVEQTASSVFPQLYLQSIAELSQSQKEEIERNIKDGIIKLKGFQTSSGGFSYWPGYDYSDDWSSSYVGHFLLESAKKGYYVPSAMLSEWKKYQKNLANTWKPVKGYSEIVQAYRLFTLALANEPEIGAMNRLREMGPLSSVSKWLLAASFKLAGQESAALELVKNEGVLVKPYFELSYTYGSDVRDQSMILLALTLLNKKEMGADVLKRISESLASHTWYSTQTTAFALLAVTEFLGIKQISDNMSFSYKMKDESQDVISKKLIFSRAKKEADADMNGFDIEVINKNAASPLFITVTSDGKPLEGSEQETQTGLKLFVYYDGGQVSQLTQGTDFTAHFTVTNETGQYLHNLVLSHIIPSGWQIHNTRYAGEGESLAEIDYQDIRDDRIYTYFNLAPGQTKDFKVLLNASFSGKYYMPGIIVEAMYNKDIKAMIKGGWVNISK